MELFKKLHVNVLFYQLPLTKHKNVIKKYYTSNSLMSYIMYLCTFGFFIIKVFIST